MIKLLIGTTIVTISAMLYVSAIIYNAPSIESDSLEIVEIDDKEYLVRYCDLESTCPEDIEKLYEDVVSLAAESEYMRDGKHSMRRICILPSHRNICNTGGQNNILFKSRYRKFITFFDIYVFGDFAPRVGVHRQNVHMYESSNSKYLIAGRNRIIFATAIHDKKGRRFPQLMETAKILIGDK